MPYIKLKDRESLHTLRPKGIKTPGELNYLITMLCKEYLESSEKNYQAMNDIIGALEGAKLEFYRRVVGPYEDKKKEENGDVY